MRAQHALSSAFAAFATAALVAVAAPAPATAAPAPQHCVATPGGAAPVCFSTFTAATRFATGGRVTDAPAQGTGKQLSAFLDRTATTTARSASVAAATVNAPVVMAYEHADFQGYSLTFVIPVTQGQYEGNCDGKTYDFPWVGAEINDKITSIQVLNYGRYCQTRLYDHIDFGGSNYNVDAKGNRLVRDFNDRASSVRIWN
ncbi:hypothetical protein [Streptomyces sp. NPDC094032]|uniref:hypothetical protein n=1 Tax=Streptomyces sp. NPDC094032 TaxID=3155308 RepID=UPI00333011E7